MKEVLVGPGLSPCDEIARFLEAFFKLIGIIRPNLLVIYIALKLQVLFELLDFCMVYNLHPYIIIEVGFGFIAKELS